MKCLIFIIFVAAGFGVCHSGILQDIGVNPLTDLRNTNIKYYLYNKQSSRGEFYLSSDEAVENYNKTIPTVVLIHDHRGHYADDFARTIRNALLDHEDLNVFVMDWAQLASASYADVVRTLPIAADDLVRFLDLLRRIKVEELVPSRSGTNHNVHLIGFGIGAHLAGNAGSQFRVVAPIARITGLDPTGKYFGANSRRLSAEDADYVEVIHTNGGLLGVGIGTAIGDVDFFINRGSNQPGCILQSCCHDRAWELYAASIPYDHLGRRCTNMLQVNFNNCHGTHLKMGGADVIKPFAWNSIYRLNTGKTFPF